MPLSPSDRTQPTPRILARHEACASCLFLIQCLRCEAILTSHDACAVPLPVVTLLSPGPDIAITVTPPDGGDIELIRASEELFPTGGPEAEVSTETVATSSNGVLTFQDDGSLDDGEQLVVFLKREAPLGTVFLEFEVGSDGPDLMLVNGAGTGNTATVAAFDVVAAPVDTGAQLASWSPVS